MGIEKHPLQTTFRPGDTGELRNKEGRCRKCDRARKGGEQFKFCKGCKTAVYCSEAWALEHAQVRWILFARLTLIVCVRNADTASFVSEMDGCLVLSVHQQMRDCPRSLKEVQARYVTVLVHLSLATVTSAKLTYGTQTSRRSSCRKVICKARHEVDLPLWPNVDDSN